VSDPIVTLLTGGVKTSATLFGKTLAKVLVTAAGKLTVVFGVVARETETMDERSVRSNILKRIVDERGGNRGNRKPF